MDDRDIFSYDNSNNEVDEGQSTFDLNSFSTNTANKNEKTQKPKKKRSVGRNIFVTILSLLLVGVIAVSGVVGVVMTYILTMDASIDIDLTNPEGLDFTTTVYVQDDKGKWQEYKNLHGEYNCVWVEYDEKLSESEDENYTGIPADLANAFIAIEDKGFKEHYGVNWKRTVGAVFNEIFHFDTKFGGSTITQQLIKNLTNDREQDAGRKIREIMRARELETKYSKDVILECYLNRVPLGHGTYGVQAAAKYYFDKDVTELSIVECACLASITKAPSYYAPDTNPDNNKTRRNTVLYEMFDQGYITKEEYEAAKEEELKLVTSEEGALPDGVNSYFIDALMEQVINDLCEEHGYTREVASEQIYKAGYKIYATVDPEIQEIVEEEYVKVASKAKKSSEGNPLWGAMTVMDYEGNVKGIVGGIGKKNSNRGFNCATDAKRQPGSTMKPIAVYAPALEKGIITYSTILNDTKVKYGSWSPKNAGGGYSGNITAQYALEVSKNTIPVMIANQMSAKACYEFATEKFGLSNLTEQDMNLSAMGLGGTNGGVTTLESAAAYAVFGNGGLYYEPTFYTKVTDQKDNVILEKKATPKMAISGDTATVINKMLQEVIYGANGTGKGVGSSVSKMRLFGKTGTSSENNDKWFVGGSPYYVVSSWCGYEDMEKIPSSNLGIAKNQWSTVMKKIHKGLKAKDYPVSDYAVERFYCKETGGLATEECEKTSIGWYKKNVLPSVCPKHSGQTLGTPEEVEKAQKEEDKKKEEDNKQSSSLPSNSSSDTSQNSSKPSSSETGSQDGNSSQNTTTGGE